MQSAMLDVNWRVPVVAWLEEQVPAKRLAHILGVESTAVALAQRYGADPALAARAGLLHDLAKYFGAAKLLSEAHRLGIAVDAFQAAAPHLLHADVSAALSTELFDEKNPVVLAAIANHTLGTAPLEVLSQILYVADWIEPTRQGEDVDRVRSAADRSLMEAVLVGAEQTILELIASQRPIHPRTILTRNWALVQLSKKETT